MRRYISNNLTFQNYCVTIHLSNEDILHLCFPESNSQDAISAFVPYCKKQKHWSHLDRYLFFLHLVIALKNQNLYILLINQQHKCSVEYYFLQLRDRRHLFFHHQHQKSHHHLYRLSIGQYILCHPVLGYHIV